MFLLVYFYRPCFFPAYRFFLKILQSGAPQEQRIDAEVDPKAIEQLREIPEFMRAFDPDGMAPEEFITFGVTQKTLTQFYHSGWALLESYEG